jgi:RNA polymerase sigma-70 factor (ECF subfamily)
MSTPDPSQNSSGSGGRFATTRWSLVLAAGDQDSPEGHEALAALCSGYWYPIYAFVRRQGFAADQAQDLTQEFFARLLEKHYLAHVNPEKGKFRSFLLASCKHFLANERDRERALKRGGGQTIPPLDFVRAESRYSLEPADALTPERLFERRWALTLLDQALERLRVEFSASGRDQLFDTLKAFLTGEKAGPYEQLAGQLDMTTGAIKVAVHRLRNRYRELLREEIARTLGDAGDIDDEIRNLFSALS